MGVALALAVGCSGNETKVSPTNDSADTADTAILADDTAAPTEDTSSPEDTDSGTGDTDTDLVTSSSVLFDVFDYSALTGLSGGTDVGFNTAVSGYLDGTMSALTATTANSFGNYAVTLFGDTATYDRGNGQTNEVAYVAITAGDADVSAAAAAYTLIRGAEMSGDLGIDAPYMLIGLNIVRNSDGSVAAASSIITQYGSDEDASSLHTLLYPGSEQQVTVIANYDQTPTVFIDEDELASAEAAIEDLLSQMSPIGDGSFTIEGDEF